MNTIPVLCPSCRAPMSAPIRMVTGVPVTVLEPVVVADVAAAGVACRSHRCSLAVAR